MMTKKIKCCKKCGCDFEGDRCNPCAAAAQRISRAKMRLVRKASAPTKSLEITQALVKELFDYSPDTGVFIRKKTTNRLARKGTVAGHITTEGYIKLFINKKFCGLHRIAWLYTHGYLPAMIDHINGNRSDNRIANLRECSPSENCRNRTPSVSTKSGLKGVSWISGIGKWKAGIYLHGKHTHLGFFEDKHNAHAAYCEAAKMLHGDFARTS